MENVLMFLTPKVECSFLEKDYTLRQALEKLEFHRYQALPVLDSEGRYIKTITEGDLLYAIKKEYLMNFKEAEDSKIDDISPNRNIEAVDCTTPLKEIFLSLLDSNFVPVNDDRGYFIGIITRKKIISYLMEKNKSEI